MGFESGELKKPLRQLELPSDGLRVGKCNQGSVATKFSSARLSSDLAQARDLLAKPRTTKVSPGLLTRSKNLKTPFFFQDFKNSF